MTDRRHERVALALEVEFRTAGAFLVAYSTNLSKGGLFLETDALLPVGSEVSLRLAVPGQPPIDVMGVVAWVQAWSTAEHAKGMGIRFEGLEQQHGDVIDRMVHDFSGLKLVVMAHDDSARGQLSRALTTVIGAADVIEAKDGEQAEAALASGCDLLMVELDMGLEDVLGGDPDESSPGGTPDGLLALRLAKAHKPPVPVIAMAHKPERRAFAREIGADIVLSSPTPFPELQSNVLKLLARPQRIK